MTVITGTESDGRSKNVVVVTGTGVEEKFSSGDTSSDDRYLIEDSPHFGEISPHFLHCLQDKRFLPSGIQNQMSKDLTGVLTLPRYKNEG